MKKAEVSVGKTYVMKVSGKLTRVRLDTVCQYGGWNGTNLQTERSVRIKSAAKLRRECGPLPKPSTIGYHGEENDPLRPERTPIIQQWEAFRENHPDKIILMRVGDFWETFDDHAQMVAKACNLLVTKRDGFSMVGFPSSQIEIRLTAILKAGHKVALCEQVKDDAKYGRTKEFWTEEVKEDLGKAFLSLPPTEENMEPVGATDNQ